MKLAILAAALLLPGASAPQAGERAPQTLPPLERSDRMNLFRGLPNCVPIPGPVAGPLRQDNDSTRLDRLPPGRVLLAVERRIDGCREAVLLSEERRRYRR